MARSGVSRRGRSRPRIAPRAHAWPRRSRTASNVAFKACEPVKLVGGFDSVRLGSYIHVICLALLEVRCRPSILSAVTRSVARPES
jgi:hypothetical protein